MLDVAADRCAAALAEDRVRVDFESVGDAREVALDRQHLDLLVDGDVLVLQRLRVPPRHRRLAERAEAVKEGGGRDVLRGEPLQRRDHLIARVEHDD